ncbi:DEAD-box type RNA helicase [Gnomoniopsis sp. IMI 355080]|nr:DEAD-box type RNA helicase [Gnomoniopsis sp. IMI 355080]
MDDATNRLYDEITAAYEKWGHLDQIKHLFCPKIDDEDEEDYGSTGPPLTDISVAERDKRIQDAQERRELTYELSLLMGISTDMSVGWIEPWKKGVEKFLTKCDTCILNYHMHRKAFLKKLRESFADGVVDIMENRLNQFDKDRIDSGLQKAHDIFQTHGAMTSTKLAAHDDTAVLAIFEALCTMPYVGDPAIRQQYFNKVFQDVQPRKPLRLGPQVLPTMTYFLFDEDLFRNRFARAAWEALPPETLTVEQYEWAVNDFFADAIQKVSQLNEQGALRASAAQIKLFWEGFLLLLRSMNEEIILHRLRGMDINTDVYHVIIVHLQTCNSDEILLLLLQNISALMQKSSKAFWGSLQDLPRAQLAQFVFTNTAYPRLLDRSLEYDRLVDDGDVRVPFIALWVKDLLQSLQEHELPDVCQSLTDHLFSTRQDIHTAKEGWAARNVAGLYALRTALDMFNGNKFIIRLSTSVTYINLIINLVVKYTKQVINPSIELQPSDHLNVGTSKTAVEVVKTSLFLDAKTTRTEWTTLLNDNSKIPRTVSRRSDELWNGVIDVFYPGRPGSMELAKVVLTATQPLTGVGMLSPPKREVLGQEKQMFNADLEKIAGAISGILNRFTSFTASQLEDLCRDTQSGLLYTLVASLVHSVDPIREAGTNVMREMTGEPSRTEAVAQMLEDYFQPFLSTFSDVVRSITYDSSFKTYAPMPHVLRCSQDVVSALCDTSGLLRSKSLSGSEHAAVMSWWTTQWAALHHSFLMLRSWSQDIEKPVLEDFCRRTMELTSSLISQDGVVASALRGSGSEREMLRKVLEQPRVHSLGMADMIKLRDVYLLITTVKTLVKLLDRLAEFNLEVEPKTANLIRSACIKQAGGYRVNTNLSQAQRAELLRALREDDEVTVVKSLKQGSLDAWSKSGGSTPLSRSGSSTPASATRDVKLTSNKLDKSRLTAEKSRFLKTGPQRLDASQLAPSRLIEQRKKEKAEKEALRAKARAARVAGEGSGLGAVLGVLGKDHAPQQKSDMMVDSSEEDDEDSDVESLVTGHSSLDPEARKRALELAAKKMGPLKKEKLKRSAKDMRARLIPPMDVLHQAILEWDIFHNGNDPPNGANCVRVSESYRTHQDYKDTFFGLLLAEAWRSFVTSKDEVTTKPFGIKVMNRMSVDKFLEVTTLMPKTQPKDKDKDRFLAEGDIVVISKSEDPLNSNDAAHCLARIWKTKFKGESLEVAYRLSSRNNRMLSMLNPGQTCNAVKITNMTTIEREYAALESLQYYDLLDEILEAKPSPLLEYGADATNQVMKNYFLNPGQAKAIMNAKDNDGFTLIQGPPGTGKTKTIVAMVGALLTGHIAKAGAGVPVSRPQLPGVSQPKPPPVKKLLVCAPSNAAVDELVLRLKQGVKTMNGAHHQINVLRLGRTDAINTQVKDVTLDELVKSAMEAEANKNGPAVSERDKMHQRAGEIKTQILDLRPRLEAARAGDDRSLRNDLEREFDSLKRQQSHIGAQIDADKDSGNNFVRESEVRRRQVQQKILDQAQVLCATLSGSGHEMFKNLDVEFDTVIIDEAAQCVELSALIPLKYGSTKCILVGDPKQLPPTVLSRSAAEFGYAQSLFVRMQQNHPKSVHLLDTQYRMHPEISAFPSKEFYDGLLYDGDDMGRLRRQSWHQAKLLGPYRFFDVEGIQERGHKGQSLVNQNELAVAVQLVKRFQNDFPDEERNGKIGIITPYKAQLFALRERFVGTFGQDILNQIEFNTTDAFQGRECEIIIFSCVRASPTGGIGFMTDIRRMNVGLTRAKSSLWILGDSKALRQGEFWNKLIEDARSRDLYTRGDVLGLLRKPSEKVSIASLKGDYGNTKLVDVEMTDAPASSYGTYNDKGETVNTLPRGMPPPMIQSSKKSEDTKKRSLEGAEPSDRLNKRPDTTSFTGDRVIANPSANMTSRGGADSGMRSGHNPGRGPRAPVPSQNNAGSAYSGSNSSYSNRGRGADIPSGPRAGMPQPRPPPKAVDPSAMEVLGLLPPERPPPPARFGGPPGYLDHNDPGPTHPTHRQQAPQQYNRAPQQQPGGSYGGKSSGDLNHSKNHRKKEKKSNRAGADPFLPKRPNRPA